MYPGTAAYNQVVRWRDRDKLPWDEIALKIGKDERTARRWYRKALHQNLPAADPVRAAIERMVGRGASQD